MPSEYARGGKDSLARGRCLLTDWIDGVAEPSRREGSASRISSQCLRGCSSRTLCFYSDQIIYCVELHHLDDVFDRSDSLGRKALPKGGLCATDFSQNACAEEDWITFESVAQDGQG